MEIKPQVQKGQHVYTFGAYSVSVDSIYGGCDKPLPVTKDKAGE